MIYLDTAASYPVLPEVKVALQNAFEQSFANSASSHKLGEDVSEHIEQIRIQIADEIGAFPSDIVFTSGATESNNIAFKSVLFGNELSSDKKHIVTTLIEHKCVFAICDYMKKFGYEITYVSPDKDGLISVDSIKQAIRPDTALVSVMHVNNELGTINNISELGEFCFDNKILFHSDCAQSFMKSKIDVDDMNIDILSLSAHKIGGPKGIGAIYIRDLRKKHLVPVIHGAGQEDGLRGGTMASPLVIGFGKAIEHFPSYYQQFSIKEIKEKLVEKLRNNQIPFLLNGEAQSLPSCLSLTLPETNTSLLVRKYEAEFCIAQGSACSSKEIEPSHVLTAIGLSRELADKTFRISFPLDIDIEDLSTFIDAIKKATD